MKKLFNRSLRGCVMTTAILSVVAFTSPVSAEPYLTYTIQQLNGGFQGGAKDINDLGIAAGTAATPDPQPAYWDEDGQVVDLEPALDIDWYGSGRAINNLGEVIGEVVNPRWYRQGAILHLLDFNGVSSGTAADINDSSVITGCVYDTGETLTRIPVIWENTVNPVVIPGTPADADACGLSINSHGHVVGTERTGTGYRAVMWKDGEFIVLGNLGNHTVTVPMAINDLGQVVGYSSPNGSEPSRAFLWDNGTMVDLGALGEGGAKAYDINNAGEIIGVAPTPVLWKDGVIYDLKPLIPSEFNFLSAEAINESGQIAGDSYIFTPAPGAFDLSVKMRGAPDPVVEGNPVTYEIEVVNLSQQAATNVILTDVLPVELTFESATTSQGSCDGGQTVSCFLGDIAAGSSASVSLVAVPFVDVNHTVTNEVRIQADQSAADVNGLNDRARDYVYVEDIPDPLPPGADMAVVQYGISTFPPARRQPLEISTEVRNYGPDTAPNATFTQAYPSSVTVTGASTTLGSCVAGQVVRCSFGDLANGQRVMVNVDTIPKRQGLISITTTVASDLPDPNEVNNSTALNLYINR